MHVCHKSIYSIKLYIKSACMLLSVCTYRLWVFSNCPYTTMTNIQHKTTNSNIINNFHIKWKLHPYPKCDDKNKSCIFCTVISRHEPV